MNTPSVKFCVELTLFLCLASVTYSWAIYPILLWIVEALRRPSIKGEPAGSFCISAIIAARNEERAIKAKLEDCLRWDYPRQLLEIIVVSDGSTDRTDEIVQECCRQNDQVRLLRGNREGKSRAQNLAVSNSTGEILVFTDVETRTSPDLIKRLLGGLADPKVGMVAGTLHLVPPGNAISKGQGMYWRYELFLRRAESAIGVLATASGVALAMRRELFIPMPACYGDDCILPLDVRLQGFRVIQDMEAIVHDEMPSSIEGELRARIRMTTRNITGTLSRPRLLNPLRFPGTAWALVSHKLLRWLTPVFLLFTVISSAVLMRQRVFLVLFILQVVFYAFGCVGWARVTRGRRPLIFSYPFSFCLANVGFLLGIIKVLREQRVTTY